MRIYRLPALIANQIAAGEVIERPASVIKELLENAFDAEADTIQIEIGFGGLNQIKVCDNGCGIVADDLELAIAAHATSKIKSLEDLAQISSLGFRGEALASISSVSRLSISSKPASQSHAMMLQVDDQGVRSLPCARSQGTTIDVQDLFYNAPVRKKFLRSDRAEFQAIESVVKQFALSKPAIALTLKHNQKLTISLPGATCDKSLTLRIKKLLGKEFIEQAIYIDTNPSKQEDNRCYGQQMVLKGWIGAKDYQRSQRDKQWIYVNRRMVKDKLLYHAIQQAYQSWLYPGRFPACLLYLEMPPGDVDVNVHPTKQELRFQEPRLVHDFMVSSLKEALESENDGEERSVFQETSRTACPKPRRMMQHDEPLWNQSSGHNVVNIKQENRHSECNEGTPGLCEVSRAPRHDIPLRVSPWFILNSQFVVLFLQDNQPYLVNFIRAYQDYHQSRLTSLSLPIADRPLLVPISYDIDKAHHGLFEAYKPMLAELGIQFDFLATTKLIVRTIPICLPSLDIGLFIKQISVALLDKAALLRTLSFCQRMLPNQCREDEQMELIHFMQRQVSLPAYCIKLDIDTCLEIMKHG